MGVRERALECLLIDGAATSFAQLPAFGNACSTRRGLSNGSIGVVVDNSALKSQTGARCDCAVVLPFAGASLADGAKGDDPADA